MKQLTRQEFFQEWSRIHGSAEIRGIVKGWLSISHLITRPLVALRISPNALSIFSVFAGIGFLLNLNEVWSLAFLVLSLLLDGIDGTVAIITSKTTKFGALIDAISDRVVEAIWAYGFFLLGAPWQLIISAWAAAFIQEYLRARAGGLGVNQVLMVTWAERPVRATLLFIPMVAQYFGWDLFRIAAICWLSMQLSSLLVLMNSFRLQLRQSQR